MPSALKRSGSGSPANQERAGCSHSITTAAATSAPMKPPMKAAERKSGTASTESHSRAERERWSTCVPRIAVAVAAAAATIATTRRISRTVSTARPSPSAGGSESRVSMRSRVSSELPAETWPKAEKTTKTEPRMISQAATVTCRGRAGAASDMTPIPPDDR